MVPKRFFFNVRDVRNFQLEFGTFSIPKTTRRSQDFGDVYRVRLGCLLPDKLDHHCPHVDFEDEHVTALYYVNKTDGDTIFFSDEMSIFQHRCQLRVEPERGKMVVFNGDVLHASSSPTSGYRIALNVNFRKRVSTTR